jgi:hypothetical protein
MGNKTLAIAKITLHLIAHFWLVAAPIESISLDSSPLRLLEMKFPSPLSCWSMVVSDLLSIDKVGLSQPVT